MDLISYTKKPSQVYSLVYHDKFKQVKLNFIMKLTIKKYIKLINFKWGKNF